VVAYNVGFPIELCACSLIAAAVLAVTTGPLKFTGHSAVSRM